MQLSILALDTKLLSLKKLKQIVTNKNINFM